MGKLRYTWRGIDRQGNVVQGDMFADTQHTVMQHLRKHRIRATRIQRQYTLPAWITIHFQHRTSQRDITQLTRRLATLLQAGVPLLQAFQILERGERNAPLKIIIQTLRQHIEEGMALNQALRIHPQFDTLYCNLVEVGELAGILDPMLTRLANHLEKFEALSDNIRSALVYPIAVLGVAITVLVLILVFVVPAFQNIFASFGAELPWLTRMVIAMSEGVQKYGIWLLTSFAICSWGIKTQIVKNTHWQSYWHRLLLRMPIAGPLTRHACTARWARATATLCAAGVPLTEALTTVEGATNHLPFQAATQSIRHQLTQGIALSQALEREQDVFPHMLIQMCAIGEESGALDHMLEKTADHYEREVDHTVNRLSTLLEPFIMVVLGLLIGGLVMALYLPIFQLGQMV